ncbi:MAG: molybdenum cofactor guanylyltransferase [Burkholderiales bacterium]|nr:molybdenum cofactor guanylyltransferase [Burkholderiales bacterium]
MENNITGLILSGGQGRRVGGVDKGLLLLDHRPLIAHAVARLRPQVGALFINANRNLSRYAAFGYPVISDIRPSLCGRQNAAPTPSPARRDAEGGVPYALPLPQVGEGKECADLNQKHSVDGLTNQPADQFMGPLAGLHAGLCEARTPWVATAPCDCPLLPRDLVARLYAAAQQHDAPLAVAKTGDRLHPVFALAHRCLLPDLIAYLSGGERKVALWFARAGGIEVAFDDQSEAFRNINTPSDLDTLKETFS